MLYEQEKLSIIKYIHETNGHIGGNKTVKIIKELGYFWENMLKEFLNYIKFDCKICINRIIGIKLNVKSKTIITKGPKERYIMDAFNLEGFIKDISGYNYVI